MKLQKTKQNPWIQKVQYRKKLFMPCFSLLYVTLVFVFPAVFSETSTQLAEPQTSRRPRFSTQSRSKRSAEKGCPERVFLPGVSSLKGAH